MLLAMKQKTTDNYEEYKKKIIDTFVTSVYLYDDKLVVYYNLTDSNKKPTSTTTSYILDVAKDVLTENHQLYHEILNCNCCKTAETVRDFSIKSRL